VGNLRDEDYDYFLSYASEDRPVVQGVRRRLEERGVTSFFDRANLVAGFSWFEPLQAAVARSRAIAVFLGPHGLGFWQKRELALALDRQAREEKAGCRLPVVPVLLPGMSLEDAPGFLMINHFIDLRGGLDDDSAALALLAPLGIAAAAAEPQAEALCPYRALHAFREEDAPLFLGRETFAAALLEKTRALPLVAVVGPSGSGKSSVVQAGLLPLLRREPPPLPSWNAVIFTPGRRPYHRLAAALVALWQPEKTRRLTEGEELGNRMADGATSLDAAFDLAVRESSGSDRLLLVVDQFEEVFTLAQAAEPRSFVERLLAASAEAPVTAVLTLRADFYGRALGLSRSLSDAIARGIVNLGPMTRDELGRAVEEPARRVGLAFEAGLVGRILDHVEQQPGDLPLVEFALTELWVKRAGKLLTHAAYDAIGGVAGAVGRRAEQQFTALAAVEQAVALRALSRLVRLSSANEEATDTRERVRLADLGAPARPVIEAFVQARLLTTGRDVATNDETVEVSHEALIRSWDRLKNLLARDREFLLWRQGLGHDLTKWQRTNRDPAVLLRGAPLEEARRWLKERGGDLSETEQAYLRSSIRDARPWLRLIAAVLVALIVLGGVGAGWWLWTKSDAYQIAQVWSEAPESIPGNLGPATDWIATQFCVGEGDAARASARWLGRSEADRALGAAAQVLARAGQARAAVEATAGMRELDCSAALKSVAANLNKAGKAKEAEAAADKLSVPWTRDSIRTALKAAAASRDSRDASVDASNEVALFVQAARELGRTALDSRRASRRLIATAAAASALAEAGQAELAIPLAEEVMARASEIEEPMARSPVLADAALALAKAGRPDAAARAGAAAASAGEATRDKTGHMLNIPLRSMVLAVVAELLVAASQPAAAVRAADGALACAQEVHDESLAPILLASAADALAKAGRLEAAARATEAARAAAKRAESPGTASRILSGMAASVAGTSLSGLAARLARDGLQVAREINDPAERSQAMASAAEPLARAGDADGAARAAQEALAAAGQVKDLAERSRTLETVAAAIGNAAKARKEAASASLESRFGKSRKLAVAARELAKAGRSKDAAEIAAQAVREAEDVFDPTEKSQALANAAGAMAASGKTDEAYQLSLRIEGDTDRSRAMEQVATSQAKLGLFSQASQSAAHCGSSADRLSAFTAIVREYYKRRGGSWRSELEALEAAESSGGP
jgi:hypothetical protein